MRKYAACALLVLLGACPAELPAASGPQLGPFCVIPKGMFKEPWAMAFLPDGHLLVTEKSGQLLLHDARDRRNSRVSGVPAVVYGGQGGLGDIVLHPDFERNKLIYLSYAEAGEGGTAGAAVARARLMLTDIPDRGLRGRVDNVEVIWRQLPKVSGRGHYGHRLAFDADGFLWVSSGERQKFDPAQDMHSNLGKLLRLDHAGRAAADNPFAGEGGIAAQIWSLGHRNPLGLAFDGKGRPWVVEMGPKGGDELNLIDRAANYGYPLVSNGDHYDGRPIPNHDTRPEFIAPKVSWTPVISPSRLAFYRGHAYPHLDPGKQHAFISGLSSKALIHVEIDADDNAREAARYPAGQRLRSVLQGPDGLLWLLEDGDPGRLLQLTAIPAGGCPVLPPLPL